MLATGGLLGTGADVTVMVIVSVSVNDPSDTVKVGVYVPVLEGVHTKVLVEALKVAPDGLSCIE